jgi:hypothetical protein
LLITKNDCMNIAVRPYFTTNKKCSAIACDR